MSKSDSVARQSVKATFLLAIGNIASTGLLTVTVLIVARLLGPSNYGQYGLALIIPNTLQLFAGLGMNIAITRYSAYHISRGEVDIAKRMTQNAILFQLIIGAILSALNFFGAAFFSGVMLHRPELTSLVQVSTIFVLGQTLLACVIGGFIGWNLAGYASAARIFQALIKLIASPVLIIFFGVLGAVFAHVISYLIIGLLGGFVLLFLKVARRTATDSTAVESKRGMLVGFAEDVRDMLRFGLPTFVGTSLSLFATTNFIVIVIGAIADNVSVGYYQAATNVTQTITLLTGAAGLSLFSAFAQLDGINADLKVAFSYSVKYVSLVMLPMVFFILGASNVLTIVFYGSAYLPSASYMNLVALSYLPLSIGLTVIPQYFNGIGRSGLSMIVYLLGAFTIFTIVPVLGAFGRLSVATLIISLIASNLFSALAGLYLARRYSDARIDGVTSARIFVASYFSFLGLYAISMITFEKYLELALDIVVFLGLYLTLVPVLRVMSKNDLEYLKRATGGLGLISKLVRYVIKYEIFWVERTESKKE